MHKFEMAAFCVKMDTSLRYFIDLTLVTFACHTKKAAIALLKFLSDITNVVHLAHSLHRKPFRIHKRFMSIIRALKKMERF